MKFEFEYWIELLIAHVSINTKKLLGSIINYSIQSIQLSSMVKLISKSEPNIEDILEVLGLIPAT